MLDDGAATIFLNAKGKADDVSPELKAFLELVNGRSSDDEFVRELDRRLSYARQNKNWKQEYMLMKFAIKIGFEQGHAEGIAIGEKLAREKLIRNFLDAISEKPWVTLDDIADMEEILMKS